MRILLLLACFAYSTTAAFAGACYSGSACRGHVLYRYGDEGTTPEQCAAEGGHSVYSDVKKHCFGLGRGSAPDESPAKPTAPSCTPTGMCTQSYCTCCTLPVPRVKFGELCR